MHQSWNNAIPQNPIRIYSFADKVFLNINTMSIFWKSLFQIYLILILVYIASF